ncbi:MAG: hypothetical protein V1922_01730 [bacterium]
MAETISPPQQVTTLRTEPIPLVITAPKETNAPLSTEIPPHSTQLPQPALSVPPISPLLDHKQLIYTAEFTKQTAEALGRCGVSTEYINPVPIGQGANHVVFEIDEPGTEKKVLKICKPATITTMTEGHIGEKEGYDQATSYFTDKYIPKTEVYKDPQSDFFCVIQNAVKGKEISNLSLRNKPELLAQLKEIVQINNRLYKDKKITLDFVGMNGFTSWLRKQFSKLLLRKSEFQVSNILVDEKGKLQIIDFEFFDLSHKASFKRRILNWFGTSANRLLMKHYFGLDILK